MNAHALAEDFPRDDEAVTPMKTLLILNDAPYGTERCYDALRLALALLKSDAAAEVSVFLMADAFTAARRGQKTPQGCYNIERKLKGVLAGGRGRVLRCGACMDARGLAEVDILEGARRSTMDALAAATVAADKVLVF